jgi:replicative DNA helicase
MDANARIVPQNIEAEQALLGAILLDNNVIDRVGSLSPQHFAKEAHQRVFAICRDLITGGRVADPTTLEARLPTDLEGNTRRYIDRLIGEATTALNAAEYGRLIYELAVKRNLIALGEELIEQCFDPAVTLSPSEQIEQAEQRLYAIAETGRYDRGFLTFAEAIAESVDMTARAYQRDGSLAGLATGLIDLDGKLGGMQDSDLIILAGRPGMGKTALGTDIAVHVALNLQQPVGFFSLEMSGEQLATRVLAEKTTIASSRMRRGDIEEPDFDRIRDAAVELQNIPLYIDEAGGLSIAQLSARARRLKRQHGLKLLVIDYLQLMRGTARKRNDNRVQEVTEITTSLKALAKELNIPILALSQLSRQVEGRDDKRPQLSDLRESGSIEQDADVVMFLYREEYYIMMRKPNESDYEKLNKWQADMDKAAGLAEVIVAKQRHGPVGTVNLQFSPEFTRFSNAA